ncbi:hypothetical protein PsorP6_001629 [Peronosclerospora sorghi]|uniref:Uncharacterized protein n=1 Tax=Peronosclerospora sorghi TaxID=230839 RepID=A0ACC0WT75_9STRA|nr:hypothetical protein PsorP6_001629 [Peronosclerospora sorghi]
MDRARELHLMHFAREFFVRVLGAARGADGRVRSAADRTRAEIRGHVGGRGGGVEMARESKLAAVEHTNRVGQRTPVHLDACFPHLVDNGKSLDHFPKDDVLAVEMRTGSEQETELTPVCIASRIGHLDEVALECASASPLSSSSKAPP